MLADSLCQKLCAFEVQPNRAANMAKDYCSWLYKLYLMVTLLGHSRSLQQYEDNICSRQNKYVVAHIVALL